MGSSSSKPAYPFPVPGRHDPPAPSKPSRWSSLSMKKRSSKGKYDDYIVPKFPQTAAYGLPYYQPAFPTYYAPVQMAVLPYGVQQPVLTMPQSYIPIPAYQAPAIQPAPAPAAMPVPAPAPAPASMPTPAPAPAPASVPTPAPVIPLFPSAPPRAAPTQMPQPYPYEPALDQGPVIPPTPILADPVIPPPPIIMSEPYSTIDSSRPRFTGFYRPTDLTEDEPARMPEPDPAPPRPPTAGPPGRTPFRTPAPMQMPTPNPAPASGNPLPAPPADVWDTSPYRHVLANLPTDVSTMLDLQSGGNFTIMPEPEPRSATHLGTFFGGTTTKDKGKGSLRGLFRSRSNTVHADAGPSGSRHGHTRSMTSIVIPPPAPSPSASGMPVPPLGVPIKFDHTGEYAGFVNHSNHRVMYQNRMYPSALHLLEAMKFTHRPDLQERIRTCKDVHDMYPLSAGFQEHVRPDWGQVFLQIMENVLYLKFRQHPTLRALLMRTGLVDIIYKDENTYWGEGAIGDGANELGKALCRVRERLRREGER